MDTQTAHNIKQTCNDYHLSIASIFSEYPVDIRTDIQWISKMISIRCPLFPICCCCCCGGVVQHNTAHQPKKCILTRLLPLMLMFLNVGYYNSLCRTVANYLLWRFVRHRVNNLDHRFQDAKQRYNILFTNYSYNKVMPVGFIMFCLVAREHPHDGRCACLKSTLIQEWRLAACSCRSILMKQVEMM